MRSIQRDVGSRMSASRGSSSGSPRLLLVALSGILVFVTPLGQRLPATPVAAAHVVLVAFCLVAMGIPEMAAVSVAIKALGQR